MVPAKACSEDFEAATSGELYLFGLSFGIFLAIELAFAVNLLCPAHSARNRLVLSPRLIVRLPTYHIVTYTIVSKCATSGL